MLNLKTYKNIFLVGFACCLFVIFIWHSTGRQIDEIISSLGRGKTKIGQIQKVQFDAFKKNSGQLIWQKIAEGEPLFLGHSIQTDGQSSTEIVLDDGQSILVGTSSLVRFIKDNEQITLDLVEGKIELKTDSEFNEKIKSDSKPLEFFVKTNTGKISTKKVNMKIEKTKSIDAPYSFEVISGQPVLIDKKNGVKNLEFKSTKIEIKKIVETAKAIPIQQTLPIESPETTNPKPLAVEKPVEKVLPEASSAAIQNAPQVPSSSFEPLPQKRVIADQAPIIQPKKIEKLKKPLGAPRVKRVDVKVVE